LSNVLAGIMILAFLVDQILFAFNCEMKKAFEHSYSGYCYLWRKLRGLFDFFIISSLESFYEAIFKPPPKIKI